MEKENVNPEVQAKCDKGHAYLNGELDAVESTTLTKSIRNLSVECYESVMTDGSVNECGIELNICDREGRSRGSILLTPKEANRVAKWMHEWAWDLAYKHAEWLENEEKLMAELRNKDTKKSE